MLRTSRPYHRERAHHDKFVSMARNKRLVRVLESLVDPATATPPM